MKGKVIAYWICTVVIAFCIGSGGVAQVLRVPQNVDGMMALGYPLLTRGEKREDELTRQ